MRISGSEKKTLLLLAKKAINERIAPHKKHTPRELSFTETLQCRCGAFVSIYVAGELRGCIGTFSEEEELYKNVENMAVSAALNDSRFPAIQAKDLPELELEISVLSPRQRIYDPSDIVIGKHGIYIKLDSNRGTFLPQVALTQNWTADEFLANCSRYKAGIGWNGWKAAELYTYEAIVFRSFTPSA